MSLYKNAQQILLSAYNNAIKNTQPTCDHKDLIDFVIGNTHLTYKYILFTALLAKATDESINPLCLQKSSKLRGAYDARTLCHKVVVKFEMETLNRTLGGSNEPFLNKPARFCELSKANPVRCGNDRAILYKLCDNLPLVKTSNDAFKCLVYLLSKLIVLRDTQTNLIEFTVIDGSKSPVKLMNYISKALERSFEGAVLTLIVAGIYHLRFNQPTDFVDVHPTNQSGASRKEVSDLDVFVNGKLISANELKDKVYTETDVRHAANKALEAKCDRLLFILGPRAIMDVNNDSGIKELETEFAQRNFMLKVVPVDLFCATVLNTLDNIDYAEFIRFILHVAPSKHFRSEVCDYLEKLAINLLGVRIRESTDNLHCV